MSSLFPERQSSLDKLKDSKLRDASLEWQIASGKAGYTYTKDWLGLPIIQRSDDIVQVSELIYEVAPTIVVETGIARGGSLLFFASMLSILDVMEGCRPSYIS